MSPPAIFGLCALLTIAPANGRDRSDVDLVTRIDHALAFAARFLVVNQSPDGAWRSKTYGCFRGGVTLTPVVLSSLYSLSRNDDGLRKAFRKGVSFLVGMVDSDGAIEPGPGGLSFPVYTAATASWVVVMESRTPENLRAQTAWLDYLGAHRLGRALGWQPSDPQFGGWGYAICLPQKNGSKGWSGTAFESNLSATLFGLGGLRFGNVPADDSTYEEIRLFVERCQNFSPIAAQGDPGFDDGGFFFSTTDPAGNKAGVAGIDRFGKTRFHSYGSATADGLRSLILCGLGQNHPRVAAARRWLEKNFTAATNPGTFAADRQGLRNATYYYYCWSVAHAFMTLGITEIETDTGPVAWAEALAAELISRQGRDGSWVNGFTDAKEDDPLVATPLAAAALSICRRMIALRVRSVPSPGGFDDARNVGEGRRPGGADCRGL